MRTADGLGLRAGILPRAGHRHKGPPLGRAARLGYTARLPIDQELRGAIIVGVDVRLIRVGHSPDADDAFMFYGIAAERVDTRG